MTTTEAQRLRSMKARLTRRFGPDDPATLIAGRKLALVHLGRLLRAARVQDWTEHEFAVLLRMVEAARSLPPGEITPAGKRCPGQAPAVPLPKKVPGQGHDAVSLAAKKNGLGVKKNGPDDTSATPDDTSLTSDDDTNRKGTMMDDKTREQATANVMAILTARTDDEREASQARGKAETAARMAAREARCQARDSIPAAAGG